MGTEREGGEARRGASLHRERVEELENENAERESLPSAWLSRREVRRPRTRPFCLPSSLHPEQQKQKRRREERRTGEESLAGCSRLSHSETQEETEACLCGEAQQQQQQQSAARLPRLCEGSRIESLLGDTEQGQEKNQGRQPGISCHDWEQEEGGGSLKSWTR